MKRTRTLDTAKSGLVGPFDGVCPAESLFDPFTAPEGQGVALVPSGTPVDC